MRLFWGVSSRMKERVCNIDGCLQLALAAWTGREGSPQEGGGRASRVAGWAMWRMRIVARVCGRGVCVGGGGGGGGGGWLQLEKHLSRME